MRYRKRQNKDKEALLFFDGVVAASLLGSAMLNVSLSGKFSNIPFDGRKAQSGLSHYPATADAWMGFDGIVGSFNLDVGII